MEVIRFLESTGTATMSPEEYLAAVDMLDIGDAERHALIARDGAALGKLLGGRERMYCSVLAPERELPEAPESPDAPAEPETPDSFPDESRD